MNRKQSGPTCLRCFTLAVVVALAGYSQAAEEQEADKENYKHYYLQAKVVSLAADQSLDSYRSGGRVSGTPGANLGCSTPDSKISIDLTVEAERFYADVTIQGRDKAAKIDAKKQRIDLTSLRPTYLDLGADKDGRTYQLNLMPSVESIRLKPVSFQKAADDLYSLRFHSSRLMLNDKQYIGRMLASNAEVFSVEICEVASLEFSLHHLKGAEPWGRLQDGQITLTHPDGTTIEIGGVANGTDERRVGGGPYTVWVRWEKSKQTVADWRASLTAYRDQIASGVTTASALTLATLNEALAREPGPWVIGCGARNVNPGELVRD